MRMTIAQMALSANRSERTIQRWIKDGRIQATPLPDGSYEVTSELFQPLTQHDDMRAILDTLQDITARLEGIEERLYQIESKLFHDQPSEQAAPREQVSVTSHKQVPVTSPNDLPSGTLTLAEMARELGISRSTLVGHCTRGTLEHESRPLQSRPGEHARFFTPEQAEAARIWHQAHSKKG